MDEATIKREMESKAYSIVQRLMYAAKNEGQVLLPVLVAGLCDDIAAALIEASRNASALVREGGGASA